MDKCCRKIAFLSLNWRDAEVRCGISGNNPNFLTKNINIL
jgi:hypothetical protein